MRRAEGELSLMQSCKAAVRPSFLGDFRSALAYTNWLPVVWGIASAIFSSDETKGNPRAAQGRPHTSLFVSLFTAFRAQSLSVKRLSFQLWRRFFFQLVEGDEAPLFVGTPG